MPAVCWTKFLGGDDENTTSMRYFILPALLISCLTFFVSTPVQSKEAWHVAGVTDCGNWVKTRKSNTSLTQTISPAWGFQIGVSAYLSGMQVRKPVMNFWNSKKGNLTEEQVWLWIDKYCSDNPLKNVGMGASELFFSHATPYEF